MENIELKILKDKCLLFNRFLIERAGMHAPLFDETNNLLEKAYQEKNIKVLKDADSDINEQVKHMPLSLALELKKNFKEKLNIDFNVVEKVRIKTIEKILKKGEISSPEEYELLYNRVDEIYADPKKVDEIKRLNELLAAYHK